MQIKAAEELGAVGLVIYSDPRDDGVVTVGNGYAPYPAGPARNPVGPRTNMPVSYLKLFRRPLFNVDLSSIYQFIHPIPAPPMSLPIKMPPGSNHGIRLRSQVCLYLLQMRRGYSKRLAGFKRADFCLAGLVKQMSS